MFQLLEEFVYKIQQHLTKKVYVNYMTISCLIKGNAF